MNLPPSMIYLKYTSNFLPTNPIYRLYKLFVVLTYGFMQSLFVKEIILLKKKIIFHVSRFAGIRIYSSNSIASESLQVVLSKRVQLKGYVYVSYTFFLECKLQVLLGKYFCVEVYIGTIRSYIALLYCSSSL